MAIKLVVRDFVRPDLRGCSILGANTQKAGGIIYAAALADGFDRMPIGKIPDSAYARETVAAWLGIPVEQIWPHHTQASVRPVRAWSKAAATAVQSDRNSDDAATLMASAYIGTHAPCRPNVHVVPIRVIHPPRPRIRDVAPLYRPAILLRRVVSLLDPAAWLGLATNRLGQCLEQRAQSLADHLSHHGSLRKSLELAVVRWLIEGPDSAPETIAESALAQAFSANGRAALRARQKENPAQVQAADAAMRSVMARAKADLIRQRTDPAHQASADPAARLPSDSPAPRIDQAPSANSPLESQGDTTDEGAAQ